MRNEKLEYDESHIPVFTKRGHHFYVKATLLNNHLLYTHTIFRSYLYEVDSFWHIF
jgi:hypothetical protein